MGVLNTNNKILWLSICIEHFNTINIESIPLEYLVGDSILLFIVVFLFVRINLKSWRYTPNLGGISTFPLSLHRIDRPKYITFCHS